MNKYLAIASSGREKGLTMSQREYVIKAVARNAGPSRWGRPQAPVKAVLSTLNLGSPKPPDVRDPEGFETYFFTC